MRGTVSLLEWRSGAEARLLPDVRRAVRQAIEAARPDVADDAELVVSELVTNATLHGEPPITVRVLLADAVRLEVEDAGRHLPVLLPSEPDAMTGRGLSMVAAVATRWGVEGLPGRGKRVWVELDGAAGGGPAAPDGDLEALLERWDEGPSLRAIPLGPVPTELLLDAEAHIEGIVRELSLAREGAADGAAPAAVALVELLEPLGVDFGDGRRQLERQAAMAAARGDALTDVVLHLDPAAADSGDRYLAALDEADRSARASQLLSTATPPVHRLLHQWCVGTAVEHLRAHAEGRRPPPPRPFAVVLGEHLGRLAGQADAAARLTLLETVTAELASATTVSEMAQVVVDQAVSALGVRSARVRVLTPRRTLQSVAWAGVAGHPRGPFADELALDADLPGPRAARSGVPEYVRSLAGAVGPDQGGAELAGLSLRALPLAVDGSVIGILTLTFRPGELTEAAELSLATALAGMLARALHAPLRREDVQGVVLEMSLRAAGVGTFDWDLVTGRLVWDRQLLEVFGRDGDGQLTIEDFYDSLHPDDRERIASTVDHVIEVVGSYEAEYRIVLPDGRVRWVAAWGRALPGPDGSTARLLGVAQDSTDRVEERARIARVMDTWATAFIFVDSDWRFTYLNAEATRVLGRRAEELEGRVIWEEFPATVGSDFERHYRHAAETGEQVAFDAWYPAPLNAWYEVRAWPGPDGLAVYFLDITARRQAEELAAQAISRMGLLARVTEELGAAADGTAALRTLAALVVPALAEWCVVSLVDDPHPGGWRRSLTEVLGWHGDPARRALVQRYAAARTPEVLDGGAVAHAAETGEVQVINGDAADKLLGMLTPGSEAAALLSELAPQSAVVLPLLGRDRPVGLLSVCNGPERGPFSDLDLELLRDVAARAGVTLDRTRLYRQQQGVAATLQRSMLTDPPRDGVPVAVRYVPAGEVAQVGGDWYDAFDQADGARTLVIGDVVGHDSLAAATMGQMRTLLRTILAQGAPSPAAALADAERVMRVLGVETLATVVVARIESPVGAVPRLVLANAGHPPPHLVESDGSVQELGAASAGHLLGVDGPSRQDISIDLPPGSTLVLHTDGLVERRDRSLEEGGRALAEVLGRHARSDVEVIADAVLAELIDGRADDDVALVVVRLPA